MEQYISKSAVLTEIENLLDKGKYHDKYDYAYRDGNNSALYALKGKLNTLEVKEVDLEKEIKEDWLFADKSEVDCLESMCLTEDMFVSLVKKYFQIGLNAQKGE